MQDRVCVIAHHGKAQRDALPTTATACGWAIDATCTLAIKHAAAKNSDAHSSAVARSSQRLRFCPLP
ncbi:hypothetical protein FQK02_19730 [Xanthomonas vasicola]|uniref:Uncharacterized protein n=1 Tax=Xanthomonas vasicola pv. vasculorum NCPPB 890 TaxID=1184265 RepID=A0A836P6K1_XANVA|nr:hypothetical protein NX80_018340 [Xanthomonas vasicola pv. arecae]KFA24041.1 hypothetical protein KW5_0120150 [Xanthomonas vasicola pv. vasculorum NCPPB 1326]KFA32658.1 hypothetical protein KWG_0106900 [Xanthomonas vasicola pv. vasculorum NCPPB 1381]KFA35868.1 hypothetical protein KWI_0111610 [Xanthomonas vasicola pv. vasculorum NCPPB 206]TWQ10679.1 hypothetical protein FQK02_19730 [Xanthomonas vasicola]